jgi:hypothetical protein
VLAEKTNIADIKQRASYKPNLSSDAENALQPARVSCKNIENSPLVNQSSDTIISIWPYGRVQICTIFMRLIGNFS